MVTKWKNFDIDRGAGDALGRGADGYGEDGDHYYENENDPYGEDRSDRDWEIADRDADYWSDDEWDPDDWDNENNDRIDAHDVDYVVYADADPERAHQVEDGVDDADAAFWQERPGRRGRSDRPGPSGRSRGVWGVRAERSGNRKRGRTAATGGAPLPLRYRVETRIAAGIIGVLTAVGLVTAVVASGDDSEQAAIDPDTGLAWCVDVASDALNGAVGDGFGIEGGNACRMQPAQATSATGEGVGDPAALAAQAGVGDGTTPSTDTTVVGPPVASGDPDDSTVANADPDDSTGDAGTTAGPLSITADYQSNLDMIRAQTVRNTTQDDSPYQGTPSAELVPENHYGPRSEYLNNPAGNPEQSFPVESGGQFRAGCEFSHFAYDDPIVFPGQPGASHLHMYFGNTDANAHSTYDSIINSGSSTCNGQELNRTAYWAPAMFDGNGNVRIPERVVVYYKGEGLANGNAELFPEEAAMIASVDLNTVNPNEGGAAGKFSFVCADNYSGPSEPAGNTIPNCDGSTYANAFNGATDPRVVLEMNIKFPQCWNGQDASNPDNFRHPSEGSWYYSLCEGEFNHTLVNLEYFIDYPVEIGENTNDWYLASDVDPQTLALAAEGGTTNHADWWGGWHKETNQMWLDNCVNFSTSAPSGCGFGYLTDGGPDNSNPADGPALKYRDQYTGPIKVSASELYSQLCPSGGSLPSASAAAYCEPGSAP